MRFYTFLTCLFTFFLVEQVSAQKTNSSGRAPEMEFAFFHNSDQSISHLNFFEKMGVQMKIEPSGMVLESQNTDQQGFSHYKYQQMHKGLPVFGCHYFLHEKAGFVRSANGAFHPNAEASPTPNFEASAAVALARKALKSRKYDEDKTKVNLCFIDPAFPESSAVLRLAYMVDLLSTEPFAKQRYFVDARNGKIIKDFPLILEEGVPSKGKTMYYGVQDIISDSVGPQDFVLRDLTRGGGVFVYNFDNGEAFTNGSSYWDLTNSSKDEVALDAHYCTEKYYDMMLGDYGWKGVDGVGGALIANVHGGAYANAFWGGIGATYGDGDCNYGPLTTLEVVGHEFTHGMVDYTSKLVYQSESGAMNESLADMFGKLLEHKTDPSHFSWNLGHSFIIGPDGKPFRVMDDPNSLGMPAYYRGLYWDDFNDVHVNSAIGNLWFSMLVDGKQGINEQGYTFNVEALGPDKTGQIIFKTNKNYLSEYSNYNDFCNYSIEVAGNLYGQGSPEQLAVTEAWKAVGLPSAQGNTYDLAIMSGNASYITNICNGLNKYYTFSVRVTNKGSITYNPSFQGSVTLSSSNFPDKVIPLTAEIAPGATQEIIVDNWLKPTDYGSFAVSLILDITDDNIHNNYDYSSYNIVQYETDDLGLDGSHFEGECFQTTQSAVFYITNNSCESVHAGTQMNIIGKNDAGNIVWTSPPIVLPYNLLAGESTYFDYEVPLVTEKTVYSLDYAADPNPSNNETTFYPTSGGKTITDNYLNTFEIDNGLDGYLAFEYFGSTPTVFYQNSTFFASTGIFPDPEAFTHCVNPLDVFKDPFANGLNASIKACVDLSGAPAPSLEFDAALLLNAYSNANNYLYSSMLQAKWDGNAFGQQIIYNQPEAEVKHTKIDLPPNFKGAVTLNLYTEAGQYFPDPSNFGTDDFVLIDNFQLSTGTLGSHEAPEAGRVSITPNPAQDVVNIRTEIPMASIRVFSAAGQLVHTFSTKELSYTLDLKGFANGLYWVNVRLENGFESVRKLVKTGL